MSGTFTVGTITYGPDYVTFPDGTPMPTQVTDALSTFLSAITTAMSDAGGTVANISTADSSAVQMAANALATLTTPLTTAPGLIAGMAYHAAMIGARAAVVAGVLTGLGAARWTRRIINPNLLMLAAQYYGDATKWQIIAAANDLSDPQPIGSFELNIPAA